MATDPRSLTGTRVCPKGRKHIGGGEAPVYEKYQIHSPNGAAEIEESLWPVRLRLFRSFPSSSLGTGLQQKLCFESEKRNPLGKKKQELLAQGRSQARAWERETRE